MDNPTEAVVLERVVVLLGVRRYQIDSNVLRAAIKSGQVDYRTPQKAVNIPRVGQKIMFRNPWAENVWQERVWTGGEVDAADWNAGRVYVTNA